MKVIVQFTLGICLLSFSLSASAQRLEIYSETGFVDIGESAGIPVFARLDTADPTETFSLAGLDFSFKYSYATCSYGTVDSVSVGGATQTFLIEDYGGCSSRSVSMVSSEPITVTSEPIEVAVIHFTHVATQRATGIYWDMVAYADDFTRVIPSNSSFDLNFGCNKGDVLFGNGVDSGDALKALYGVLQTLVLEPVDFCAADMDSDGFLTTGDVVAVLRKAVGAPAPRFLSSPSATVGLEAGTQAGYLTVSSQDAAGLLVELSYDPVEVRYVGVSSEGGALAAANEIAPGQLLVGVAQTDESARDIQVEFELLTNEATVHLVAAEAHGADSMQKNLDLGSTQVTLTSGGSATPTPAAQRALLFEGGRPNPFNPRTTLYFQAPGAQLVLVRIYTASGRQVREAKLTPSPTGTTTFIWDGTDVSGTSVASGVYRVEARQGAEVATGSVVLVR